MRTKDSRRRDVDGRAHSRRRPVGAAHRTAAGADPRQRQRCPTCGPYAKGCHQGAGRRTNEGISLASAAARWERSCTSKSSGRNCIGGGERREDEFDRWETTMPGGGRTGEVPSGLVRTAGHSRSRWSRDRRQHERGMMPTAMPLATSPADESAGSAFGSVPRTCRDVHGHVVRMCLRIRRNDMPGSRETTIDARPAPLGDVGRLAHQLPSILCRAGPRLSRPSAR